jgi:RHS repeat-associated protein
MRQYSIIAKFSKHPFGMVQPNRKFNSNNYNFGFGGKRKDNEIFGSDGSGYEFGARIYNCRIGRWFSPDPLFSITPDLSPFVAFNNNPISIIDPTGLIGEPVTHKAKKGDNYSKIGKRYGISVKDLMKWNKYNDKHIPIGAEIRLNPPDKNLPVKDLTKLIDLDANANKVNLSEYDNNSHDIDKVEDHLNTNKAYKELIASTAYKKNAKNFNSLYIGGENLDRQKTALDQQRALEFRMNMSKVEIGALGVTISPYIIVPLAYEAPGAIIAVYTESETAIYYYGTRLLNATASDLYLAMRWSLRNRLTIDQLLRLEKLASKFRNIEKFKKEIKNIKELYDDIKKVITNF